MNMCAMALFHCLQSLLPLFTTLCHLQKQQMKNVAKKSLVLATVVGTANSFNELFLLS